MTLNVIGPGPQASCLVYIRPPIDTGPCDVRVGNHLLELPLSLRRPMGCFSSKPTRDDPPPVAARGVTSQVQSSQVVPPVAEIPRPSSRQSGAKPGHESPQSRGVPSSGRPARDRGRVQSTPGPQKAPSMKDVELPPLPPQRSRATSSFTPSSRGPISDRRQVSAGECDHGWLRVLSLTMIRVLEGISQTTNHELSRS